LIGADAEGVDIEMRGDHRKDRARNGYARAEAPGEGPETKGKSEADVNRPYGG